MTLPTMAVRFYGAAARVIPFGREPFRSLFNAAYFAYKRFEDPFATLIAARPDLFRGGSILDIGANVGYTTLLFARLVHPPFVVHAVEPHPGCAALLQRNARRSRLEERIRLYTAAAGATHGAATLSVNRFHPGDHRIVRQAPPMTECLEVELVRADDLIGSEPVSFVKIDVQGFELEVSRGMTGILDANPHVTVALEYAPAALRDQGVDPRSLFDFYTERRFSFHLFDHGVLKETSVKHVQDSTRGENYVNILCLRR